MAKLKKQLPILPRSEIRLLIGKGKKKQILATSWKAYSPSSELTRSQSFWNTWSSCSEEKMLRFLRLRAFWLETNFTEREFAFSHPKFLNDVEFNALLTVLATTELTKSEIVRRCEYVLNLIGKRSNFREGLLKQWDSNILISSTLTTGPIGKHKAFSGWVRNSSSVGSKRSVRSSNPEPLAEDFSEDMFDEYEFLVEAISVGSIESNLGIIRLS